MRFGEHASRSGCALNLSISVVPWCLRHSLGSRKDRYAQRAIRFSETTDNGIREAAEKCGFSSSTALIRNAVEQELPEHNLIGQARGCY